MSEKRRRLFKTLPLGARFKYVGGTDIWVVLERHGCGLVAKWGGNDGWVAGQAICAFAETEEECSTEEVMAIDWTDAQMELSAEEKV